MNPLKVDEGGRVSISSENVEITLDYSKYGIRDTEILFHVIEQPAHGVVDVSGRERHDGKRFSYFDMNADKVY